DSPPHRAAGPTLSHLAPAHILRSGRLTISVAHGRYQPLIEVCVITSYLRYVSRLPFRPIRQIHRFGNASNVSLLAAQWQFLAIQCVRVLLLARWEWPRSSIPHVTLVVSATLLACAAASLSPG